MAAQSHFFSHDFNTRNNLKILELRIEFGWSGYGLFWAMLEVMAEADARLNKDKLNLVSYQLQISPEELRTFVSACLRIGLLQEDEDFLYCKALDERLEHKRKSVEKAKKAAAARWNAKEDAQAMQEQCTSNANKTKLNQTKQNKISIEESKDSSPPPAKRKTLKDTIDQRKQKFIQDVKAAGSELYVPEMINAFIGYWSEPNQAGAKLRFELEKTWSSERRLQVWANRTNLNNGTPYKQQVQKPSEDKNAKRIESLRRFLSNPPEDADLRGAKAEFWSLTGEHWIE